MSHAGIGVGSGAVRRRGPAQVDRLTSFGVAVAVLVLFGMSGGMLWMLGYNYEGLAGSPITKIHPFTYMAGLLLAWRTLASGNPVGFVVGAADRRPAAMLLAVAGLLMLAITVARGSPGMAGFVDTFVSPALLAFLLAEEDDGAIGRLTVLLHLVMTVNAVMALEEFATRTLVFPYRFDGEVFPNDLRSTALQGHPLVNASITCCYVLGLLNGARSLSAATRVLLIALQCAAMVVFGGRSALVVTLVLGGGYAVVMAIRALRGRTVPLLGIAFCILLVTLVPVAVATMSTAGFFDALLLRFASDGGSANARVEMLDLFRTIPLRDLLVGPDTGLVDSLRRIDGLEWGIENPIVRLILYQGAFPTAALMVVFSLFIVEVACDRDPAVWLNIAGFVVLLNTAESIGAKTTLVAKFVVLAVCLYRRRPKRNPGPRIRTAAWSDPGRR